MSVRAVRAFQISLALALLALVFAVAIRQPRSVVPEWVACSTYKGQASEGYEQSGNTLFIKLPSGGTAALQNFSNGAAGITLTTRSVDPSRGIAEVKC